jgi:hypothetical protein
VLVLSIYNGKILIHLLISPLEVKYTICPQIIFAEAEMDEGKIATVLHLNRKKEMETQEGTVLLKECAYAIERLSNYKFTFDSINTEEGNEELLGIGFIGVIKSNDN